MFIWGLNFEDTSTIQCHSKPENLKQKIKLERRKKIPDKHSTEEIRKRPRHKDTNIERERERETQKNSTTEREK